MKKRTFKDLIIQESDDYIFINKPPFISTLEDRNDRENILKLAREYQPSLSVCHRLDKETSGILALSKNQNAYSHLAKLLEKRVVKKVYHAVVIGIHDFKNLEVNASITAMNGGIVKIDKQSGKKSLTIFDTIKAFKKNTLVACRPESGRMHQIRIHLALLKAPIVGDVQYGGKDFYLSSIKPKFNLKKGTEEQPLMKRVALHALSLQFPDIKGNDIKVEADYPKDFGVLVKQMELHS